MDAILDNAQGQLRTAAERKAAAEKAEREADLAFLARQKKRKPADPAKMISHVELKKSLGL